jgi:protein TonB
LSGAGLVIYQNGKVVFREKASAPGKKANSPPGQNTAGNGTPEEASSAGGKGGTSEVSLPAGITGGRLLKSVRPQYPAEAILDKREGSVVLHGTVSQDGGMQDVKIVSGDPLLRQAAAEAVQQWKYEPYRRNGKPIDMPIDITIDFNLPK